MVLRGHPKKELRQVGERLKLHEKQALNKSHINKIEMAFQAENAKLKERFVKLEEYSRRKYLLFNGFEESQGDNCVQFIHQYIWTQLQLQVDRFQIENAHRKCPKVPRPICSKICLNSSRGLQTKVLQEE